MTGKKSEASHRKTIRTIRAQKGQDPLVCLTAYTAPVARFVDQYADLILVGDSLGMVLYGMESTVPVTVDMMAAHGRAVVKATQRALIVVDMPFGSYQESPEQAFRNAAFLMKETGCTAVKLEGGAEMAETVEFLVQRGVPVMGHVGLRPQSVNSAGGYRTFGKNEEEHKVVLDDARAVADAGAFSIVLECTTPELSAEITQAVSVPTIGIGAGLPCDGQILVTEDMLGLTGFPVPKFVKKYADLGEQIEAGIAGYADEVRGRVFPEG